MSMRKPIKLPTEGIARYLATQIPKRAGVLMVQILFVAGVVACYRYSCQSDHSCLPLPNLLRDLLSVMPSHLAVGYRFSGP